MPATDESRTLEEWWVGLPEADYAAFCDLVFSRARAIELLLKLVDDDGTVGDARDRFERMRQNIESMGSLEEGYLGAFLYGKLGLVVAYLEKFDGGTPVEAVPGQLEEDIRGWMEELDELLDEK